MEQTEKGSRFNEGKAKWSLLPLADIEGVVRVLESGERKYGRNNWRKGLDLMQTFDATMRHLKEWHEGIETSNNELLIDKEDGLCHIDHAICNLLFIKNILKNENNKNKVK